MIVFLTFNVQQHEKTFKVLFYLKKPKDYASGTVPIYLRLTVDGERVEWSTQRECESDQWNNKAGRVKGTSHDLKAINGWLEQLNAQIY